MKSLFSDGKRSGYIEAKLSETLFAKRGGSFSMLAILIAILDSSPKCLISSLLKSKFWPSIETDDNEDLILFISTGSVKFTATSVPPLKSMLSLGPPLVINDTAPTKISSADMQLAMNVLLIKSIFVSLTILIIKYSIL